MQVLVRRLWKSTVSNGAWDGLANFSKIPPDQFHKAGYWRLAAKSWSLSGGFGNQLFLLRLGMGWPTLQNCPEGNSIRLGLGAWLQNAGAFLQALKTNFFEIGLGWAGQLFQNAPKPIL